MKKNLTLLACCCLICINLTGQQPNIKPDLLSVFSIKTGHLRSPKIFSADSFPVSLKQELQRLTKTPALKSMAGFRQKMDSCHIQRYFSETNTLRTLNRDKYQFDDKGRLVLTISYTNNTPEDTYQWRKDTVSFDSKDLVSMQANYIKILESDPWSLQFEEQSYHNAHGDDTLAINTMLDWETGGLLTAKIVSVYDDQYLLTSSISYLKDNATGKWTETTKNEMTYDSDGNVLTLSVYEWSTEIQDWIQTGQFENSYDSKGKSILMVSYIFNQETKTWVGISRAEYSYDSSERPISLVVLEWNAEQNQWINRNKLMLKYDTNGNRTEFAIYFWDPETAMWLGMQKMLNEYDSGGNITLDCMFLWDNETKQWVGVSKEEILYDTNGNAIEYLDSNWNSETGAWTPEWRETDTFDSGNRRLLTSTSNWDTLTTGWIEYGREEHDYDSYGNLTQSRTLNSKDSTGQWSQISKFDYTYDNSYNADEILTPYGWNGVVPVHMFLRGVGQRWVPESGDWLPTMVQDYYYSEFTSSSVPDTGITNIVSVFPNPANNVIYILTGDSPQPASFELLDLQGRKVLTEVLVGNRNQINVSSLPAGLYLYKVIRTGKTSCGKITIH